MGARQLGPGEVLRVVRGLASPGHTFLSFFLAGQPTGKGLGPQGRRLLCVPWVSACQRPCVVRRLPFISVSAVTRNTIRRLHLAYSGTCVEVEGTLRGGAGCSSAASWIDSAIAAQAGARANRFSLPVFSPVTPEVEVGGRGGDGRRKRSVSGRRSRGSCSCGSPWPQAQLLEGGRSYRRSSVRRLRPWYPVGGFLGDLLQGHLEAPPLAFPLDLHGPHPFLTDCGLPLSGSLFSKSNFPPPRPHPLRHPPPSDFQD